MQDMSADQMMLAIERGVEKAIGEKIGRNHNHLYSSHELFRKAIADGTKEAVKATIMMPTEFPEIVRRELFDAITKGVRDGIVEAARQGYIKP